MSVRRRGLPLPVRVLLVVAVVALGAAVFATATGGIGPLVRALGTSLSGLVDEITATPTPSSTPLIVADAPRIASPTEPYTNLPRADLQITIPDEYVGDPDVTVRIYLALEGVAPTAIAEAPVGSTIRLIVPVDLTPGRNDFTATIIEATIESEASPIVTFILDTEPPAFVLATPVDGETINRESVLITGTTQPRTTLLARNEANGISISGQAGADGTFSVDLPIEPGPNGIRLSGTDPAGNPGELIFSVVRGSGELTATLTASSYRISMAALPVSLQLSVLVTDPDGLPLEGAAVTFSVTVPGIPPVAKDAITGGDGRATYTTTLSTGLQAGPGLVTVLVATADFGTASSQKTVTIVE